MAAVTEKKDPAAPFASQVDEQLAQATSRIRAHDLAFGGLLLAAILLGYAAAMIVLDKSFALPAWARQLALAAFLGALAAAAYLTIARPLRRRINPLYAARQVENTLDDNKNSVTGYVDAQENGDLNPTVKAALASRAAKAAADADVNRAVDHRSLLYLGGVAVALLLTLIVLFLAYRPAQFGSLMKRTFNPFASTQIGTRTQIAVLKPDPADATVTEGQPVTVSVHIAGKVPAADGPDRVRLLVRHNLNNPAYDEVPMLPGEGNRDFELRVPDYLVQSGFWYKVAAGDAETPEHRVTVRSLPRFTDFQTTYDYPAYTRFKTDTTNSAVVRAPRGTKVTLTAKANRAIRDGLMLIEPTGERIAGVPVPGRPDGLQFVIPKLAKSGRYKLNFTAADGEAAPEAFTASITVEEDRAPTVVVNKPEEAETQVPANGQLAIDGSVGDDFGIDAVTLKMRLVEPVQRPLPDVPYLNGMSRSFKREKDNTWPTDLAYKGSVDFAKLKTDATATKLDLEADMVIEFWLEAADNCTEPKPNVGRSATKRVRLTRPKTDAMDKQQLNQEKQERQNEEQKHNAQQQKKFDQEKRDPDQKNGDGQKGGEQRQQGKQADQKNDGQQQNDKKPNEKQPNEKQPNDKGGMGGEQEPKDGSANNAPQPKQDANPPKKDGGANGMGTGDGMDMNSKPEAKKEAGGKGGMGQQNNQAQQDIENNAKDFEKQIQEENKNGGAGKSNPTPKPEERDQPGQAKPQPKDGGTGEKGMNNAAEPKPEPKQPNPNDPISPMGGNKENSPAQSKPEGKVEKSQAPATTKPEPKQGGGPKGEGNAAPSEKRNEPAGAPAGTDKEPPKEPQPAPKNSDPKRDPASGSAAKPASDKQPEQGEPMGAPNSGDKQDPASKAGTGPKPPMRDPSRGEDKPSEQPKGGGTGASEKKPDAGPEGGDAKPQKAPAAGGAKPKPPEDMTDKGGASEPKPEEGANEPKNPNGTGAAESKPDQKPKQPMAGGKSVDKGTDKPQRKDGGEKGRPNGGEGAQKKPDPEQLKKLEEAAKNLNSPDPQKRADAQKALDKAVGEQNRKELEQLQKDLNSPDKDKQAAAQKKIDDLKKQMQNAGDEGPEEKGTPELDGQQKKEMADALKDLQGADKGKQQQAREKLDKMVGEQNRKEAEQLMNDLKSDDEGKRAAAQKKLDDLKKQMDQARKDKKGDKTGQGEPKGKEPTPEEVADLAKKAQDLNSPDEQKRKAAEEELDDKIGKENREKVQEEMKNKKPDPKQQAENLKDKMREWQEGPGGGPRNKGPMEEDKKNRLKSAELNLEHFESEEYRKKLQASKGWTDEEYERFLDGYKRYVEGLRNEAASRDKPAAAPMPGEAGRPLNAGGAGRVESAVAPGTGTTTVGGPTAAPPGFEDARRKFEEALKKKR